MANRYHRPADDDNGDAMHALPKTDSDPLAELARLIGQTDPFSNFSRGAGVTQPAGNDGHQPDAHRPDINADADDAVAPLPWMRRANAQNTMQNRPQDLPQDITQDAIRRDVHALHPVQRYGADHAEPEYHQAPPFAADAGYPDAGYPDTGYPDAVQPGAAHPGAEHADPGRYDEALYGQMPGDEPHSQNDPYQADGYQNEPYAYPDGYGDASAGHLPRRRGGLVTVALVLALAVVGTGAAFAYRTYVGSPRSGEPPVIKAETAPTKVVPPSAAAAPAGDASGKLIQDRLATGAPEKLVSREEQPVNVQDNTKAGPRVVFPPLNQNANPPPTASVAPAAKPLAGNAALQGGDEPRKIRTFTVRGDQADLAATPAARPAAARVAAPATAPVTAPARGAPAVSGVAPSGNAPLSLSPQATPPADTRSRVASNAAAPQQIAPAAAGGGYLVQVSSQRNEADAQASYRALQGKFPAVLGSRPPMIKRADLGDKGTYYRAMVGPFGSPDEASAFCGNLKTAGGQCVVQRN